MAWWRDVSDRSVERCGVRVCPYLAGGIAWRPTKLLPGLVVDSRFPSVCDVVRDLDHVLVPPLPVLQTVRVGRFSYDDHQHDDLVPDPVLRLSLKISGNTFVAANVGR